MDGELLGLTEVHALGLIQNGKMVGLAEGDASGLADGLVEGDVDPCCVPRLEVCIQ